MSIYNNLTLKMSVWVCTHGERDMKEVELSKYIESYSSNGKLFLPSQETEVVCAETGLGGILQRI